MELSDVTQHQRRIRALLNRDDLRLLIARAVASEAGVSLTDPRVKAECLDLPILGAHPAASIEVILVVDKSTPVLHGATQDESAALRDAK